MGRLLQGWWLGIPLVLSLSWGISRLVHLSAVINQIFLNRDWLDLGLELLLFPVDGCNCQLFLGLENGVQMLKGTVTLYQGKLGARLLSMRLGILIERRLHLWDVVVVFVKLLLRLVIDQSWSGRLLWSQIFCVNQTSNFVQGCMQVWGLIIVHLIQDGSFVIVLD